MTRLTEILPWLTTHQVPGTADVGVPGELVVASEVEAELAADELSRRGYAVPITLAGVLDDAVDPTGSGRPALRAEQRAIGQALDLPSTAARNLDALVDSLRDLRGRRDKRPDSPGLVLVWSGAGALRVADPKGHAVLSRILVLASGEYASTGWVFETIAVEDVEDGIDEDVAVLGHGHEQEEPS